MADTRKITLRHWCVLFFACTIMLGNYYCYDIPAALNVPLKNWLGTPYDQYQWQINLLYTVYSIPNIVLPLIGGILIDRLGISVMLGLFATCVCLGQTVFASGIQARRFPVMLAGRILFGLGGESLEVAQARITTDWFKGRSLGFALGLNLSASRLATAANDVISPWIAEHIGTAWAGWMGCMVCLTSFGCGMATLYLDRPSSRAKAGVEQIQIPRGRGTVEAGEQKPLLSHSPEPRVDNGTGTTITGTPAEDESASKPNAAISSVVVQSDDLNRMESLANLSDEDDDSVDFVEEDETVHFGQIVSMSSSFWCLCLVTIMLYGAAVPFFHICTDFFQQKWYPGDAQMAGIVMSIPDIISAIGSPICGLFVDRYGQRGTLLPIAGILTFTTHALLCFTTISPIVSMSVLGVSYSVFASAIWPCVPYLVGPHQIATAYGLVTVALNISLACFPLIVARVRIAHSEDFTYVEYFFMGLSLLATLASIWLNVIDSRNGWVLSKTHRTPGSPRLKPMRGDSGGGLGGEDEHGPLFLDADGEDGEDEEVTVKIVGDGIQVPTRATYIHHHHHQHHHVDEFGHYTCNCALNNGGWDVRQPISKSWSPSVGGSQTPPVLRRPRARSRSPVKGNTSSGTSSVGNLTVGIPESEVGKSRKGKERRVDPEG